MKAKFIALALVLAVALWAAPSSRAEESLLVFAAASTTDAISAVGQAFSQKTGVKVTNSFASSSTLAKQIAHGAPADVFISANQKWMDYLDKEGFVATGTRADILRNQLVIIAPADSAVKEIALQPGLDLSGYLGEGRLSLGDPSHVPAGMYAKEALVKLGMWGFVQDRAAASANVRAALALVERGEAPLGVVYATDARVSQRVKVVSRFPADSHTPITYPAAVVKNQDGAQARAYLEFLKSPQAGAIFKRFGFAVE